MGFYERRVLPRIVGRAADADVQYEGTATRR
jgi:hypothetical protein